MGEGRGTVLLAHQPDRRPAVCHQQKRSRTPSRRVFPRPVSLREPSSTAVWGDTRLTFNAGKGIKAPTIFQATNSVVRPAAAHAGGRRWPRPQASVPSAPSAGATSMSASSRVCGGAARASASLTSTTRSTISWSRSAARCCRTRHSGRRRCTGYERQRQLAVVHGEGVETSADAQVGRVRFAASYTHLNATITKSLSRARADAVVQPGVSGHSDWQLQSAARPQPFRRPANTGKPLCVLRSRTSRSGRQGIFAGSPTTAHFSAGPMRTSATRCCCQTMTWTRVTRRWT